MDTKAMRNLVYGLHVLTARDGAKDNGCIINTGIQVTTSPNRMVIAVSKQNYTHDMLQKTGLFNLSFISEKAPFPLFQNFGFQTGREIDKFAAFPDVKRSENGLYYISGGTNAFVSAKVLSATDLVTHTLFLADVTDAAVLSSDNSMTYDYYHKNVKQTAPAVKGWRCRICGYVYEGETLPPDFVCPICKHGAEDFEKIT